ncbi:diaminopimelate epimerase [Halalkalicoccus sp. NIPERK01]|uniref:diaminopimelate epimerase n=1 Tax=Halalkalicoccus sp. NIPERK01 TaxID=3053469 RepID=UPI00256F553F|nr:diaminopimelate epimerase [Halalkalicoccus sp. NIPERK01]MDL5361864.1 diaminopimelate epimerase [Halalkalicoccus sp. NIPERK01]
MAVAYEKYHGTGNDFLVCEAGEEVENWGAFAAGHCDRETGLAVGDRRGADGVLVLSLEGDRVRMRLYQPDGGTAAMCGNGARCAARWAARRLRRLDTRERPEAASGARRLETDSLTIDTPAGERRARVGAETIEIEMGIPSFAPPDVPLAHEEPLIREEIEGWEVTAVNTGVPHAVVFVDDVSTTDLDAMAPPIRHSDRFPEGANVNLASERDGGFAQRTFERGVEGETRSCGTGAVAIAAVARRLGLVEDERVRVSPPGGELLVEVPDQGPTTLSGPVEFEGAGEVPAP